MNKSHLKYSLTPPLSKPTNLLLIFTASFTQIVVLNSEINNKLQHQQNCSKAFHTAVALFTQNMINWGREKSLGNRKEFVEAQNCGTQVKTCMEHLTGAWLCRNNESAGHFNGVLSHNLSLFSEDIFHFSKCHRCDGTVQ